jgi:hypothetical protein
VWLMYGYCSRSDTSSHDTPFKHQVACSMDRQTSLRLQVLSGRQIACAGANLHSVAVRGASLPAGLLAAMQHACRLINKSSLPAG